METKICSKCKKEKNITEFRTIKQKDKIKLNYYCRSCEKEYKKEYNKKYWQEKKYYFQNYRIEHKEQISKYKKEYQTKNIEKHRESSKKWFTKNKEKTKKYQKEYEEKNAEKISERKKRYREKNRDKINKRMREYTKKRKEKDELFTFKKRIRGITTKAIARKGYTKRSRSYEILGCDYEFLIKHLLYTFKNNYGYEWDKKEKIAIDHIIPLAIAKSEEEVIRLCHYSNLQLLKMKDNIIKSDKLDWSLEKL